MNTHKKDPATAYISPKTLFRLELWKQFLQALAPSFQKIQNAAGASQTSADFGTYFAYQGYMAGLIDWNPSQGSLPTLQDLIDGLKKRKDEMKAVPGVANSPVLANIN